MRLCCGLGTSGCNTWHSKAAAIFARRQVWQAQIQQLLQDQGLWARAAAAERATAEGVRALLSILLGDDSALLAATATWLEYLSAQALHVYPTLRYLPRNQRVCADRHVVYT